MGGSPGQGWCWGQEGPAEVSQRCSKMEGEGTPPCSPRRDSRGTWDPSWHLEDASAAPVMCGVCSQPRVAAQGGLCLPAGNGTPTPGHSHGRERHWLVPQQRNNRGISHALAQSPASSRYRDVCVCSGGGRGCWAGAGAALGVPTPGTRDRSLLPSPPRPCATAALALRPACPNHGLYPPSTPPSHSPKDRSKRRAEN